MRSAKMNKIKVIGGLTAVAVGRKFRPLSKKMSGALGYLKIIGRTIFVKVLRL